MRYLEYLVVTMQQLMGPLPVHRLVLGAPAGVLSCMAPPGLVRLPGGARHA